MRDRRPHAMWTPASPASSSWDLSLYRDPIVARNTSESDFSIDDLMDEDVPRTLYLIVRPSDQKRLMPLVRLKISQIIRRRTEHMEFSKGRSVKHYKNELLLLIDEFASLGRISVVEEAIAYIRGFGLRFYGIVQDLEQLMSDKAYGRNESITSNCGIRIAFAPNKHAAIALTRGITGLS